MSQKMLWTSISNKNSKEIMIVLMALEMTRNTKITIKYIYLIIFKTIFTEIQITLFTIITGFLPCFLFLSVLYPHAVGL